MRRGVFRLLESALQVALCGYGRLCGCVERGGGFRSFAFPAARFRCFLSFGRRRKIFFQFFFPLVIAFPDFGLAGSGGREFRLDGAGGARASRCSASRRKPVSSERRSRLSRLPSALS